MNVKPDDTINMETHINTNAKKNININTDANANPNNTQPLPPARW